MQSFRLKNPTLFVISEIHLLFYLVFTRKKSVNQLRVETETIQTGQNLIIAVIVQNQLIFLDFVHKKLLLSKIFVLTYSDVFDQRGFSAFP